MYYYIGRQPIFDRLQNVFGYELLYRSGTGNFYDALDPDCATSDVITNSILMIGLDTLTRGRRAFVNFTRNLLLNEYASLLPHDQIVVEITEDIEIDDELVKTCRDLKAQGYMLALDDFNYQEKFEPLLGFVDIIKVDFFKTPPGKRRLILDRLKKSKVRFLAEKVESFDEFREAVKMGYTYFQGYFFAKPVVVSGKDIPPLYSTFTQLLQEMNRPDVDIGRLEKILKEDVSLTYKLLRMVNSAAFGLRREITSIRQALMLVGCQDLRKWASLVFLRTVGQDKPDELMVTAITRAHFCETIAPMANMGSFTSDLFLTGLFSLIDVLLEQPMAEVLAKLPVSKEIKGAILNGEPPLGPVLNLIKSYEQADFEAILEKAKQLGLQIKDIFDAYIDSLAAVQRLLV